jgi:hypothetical protein
MSGSPAFFDHGHLTWASVPQQLDRTDRRPGHGQRTR